MKRADSPVPNVPRGEASLHVFYLVAELVGFGRDRSANTGSVGFPGPAFRSYGG